MKKLVLSLGILLLPLQVLAEVELFQLVMFDWEGETKKLKLVSLGSGTSIGKDLIITNKHVVEINDEPADLILLCQAKQKATHKVECNIPAGISILHRDFDVALVKPIVSGAFIPQVRTSTAIKRKGDVVRIVGFPAPDGQRQNFGGQATLNAFKTWEADPTTPLQIRGDKPTITRGEILARYKLENTGETFALTSAKVNFGNSGGAAFDQFGDFVGIPSLKDREGNAFILEYAQIYDWVNKNSAKKPQFDQDALNFYNQISNAKAASKSSRWAGRLNNKSSSATTATTSKSDLRAKLRARLLARKNGISTSVQSSNTTTSRARQSLRERLKARLAAKRAQLKASKHNTISTNRYNRSYYFNQYRQDLAD